MAAPSTLIERIKDAQDLKALRARIAASRCAYCNGLACGHRQADNTWRRS